MPNPILTRPYDGMTLKKGLRQRARWEKGRLANWSDAQRPECNRQTEASQVDVFRLAAIINKVFLSNKYSKEQTDLLRHAIYRYIFGVASGYELLQTEIDALLVAWENKEENHWLPNQFCERECFAILQSLIDEQGQLSPALQDFPSNQLPLPLFGE